MFYRKYFSILISATLFLSAWMPAPAFGSLGGYLSALKKASPSVHDLMTRDALFDQAYCGASVKPAQSQKAVVEKGMDFRLTIPRSLSGEKPFSAPTFLSRGFRSSDPFISNAPSSDIPTPPPKLQA